MINRSRSALGRGGLVEQLGEALDLHLVLGVEIGERLDVSSGGTLGVHGTTDGTGSGADDSDNDGLSGDSEEHGIFLVV